MLFLTKTEKKKKINRIFIKGMLIIAFVAFVPNLITLTRGKIVPGIIIDIKEVPSVFSSKITSSYPVVLFNTDDQSYKFIGAQNLNVKEGEQVDVIFNPRKPEDAKILSFAGFWLKYLLTMVSGIFFWYALITSFPDRMILNMFSKQKTHFLQKALKKHK